MNKLSLVKIRAKNYNLGSFLRCWYQNEEVLYIVVDVIY
ncbi:hypothetical protein DFH84_003606 [Clostridium saccharobutylicum]|uniref:Uncharacterized protein n=1 Tax=Clostridium saccharobutylicum DSM 13864 TaxID=1345695 RepID=U5MMM8_CLOSA|nr:hypothetical protein CLSA_c07700 [Clostridium saccharobutylicum DSM 13864]MBA9000352.1 hypothetical protein [Clostridium saccharobutylicum]NOV56563.1 hypothetical protein [Clostridium saccharobutylicum]NOV77184.1 hypothetical protein [Clostridium saccharobutylicum]NOV86304.1 hypothetical protein [Clostridium saccharobutylicum]